MSTLWTIVAIVAAAAGIVCLIHEELRAHRSRQAVQRLEEASRTQRKPSAFAVDVDRQLRNRSERWD